MSLNGSNQWYGVLARGSGVTVDPDYEIKRLEREAEILELRIEIARLKKELAQIESPWVASGVGTANKAA